MEFWGTVLSKMIDNYMASDKGQLDFVLDQMKGAGVITARSMFGEYYTQKSIF
jgi:TfoX/Sxy family transcriptional regulator of competence genes